MTDEQIIKRRLIFDGEGIGDDRRIYLLQKMIAKWILTENASKEENEMMYNKILLQLSLLEHSRQKSEIIKLKNERQLQQYQKYENEIIKNEETIKNTINTSKLILTEVKCEKHQKLNYDMIVKDIVEQPSRVDTTALVKQHQLNISKMKDSQKRLKNEYALWRKHFSVLITSANQMCVLLDELKDVRFDNI